MALHSEFTEKDLKQIADSYAELKQAAVRRCRGQKELDIVQKAFDFANSAHQGIRRRSGEPYIIHPLEVAKIVVTDIGLGYKSIATALLHDVVEDTDYTVEDIRNLFGEKIASLVEGLTKIKTVLDKKGRSRDEESIQAENFKRILLTINDDVRVVLVKLADRLHNCRTIEYMPEYKRDKILSETMFIFIPLAHRLGLYGVKSEMEDIWLRYKEPEAFEDITQRINALTCSRDGEIDKFIAPIESALNAAGFSFEIKKRIKTPYSIWHKIQTKGVTFDQVYDLYAVRIIFEPSAQSTESERDMCYHIFSVITDIYRYKSDRVRDWVKHPKNNGYEALHCTLMSNSGIWIEVQIRSKRMNDIAEKGIAAHWAYKNGGYAGEGVNEMDLWISKIKEILVNPNVNALELLDIIHSDLVTSDIFVFTRKGEQRRITKGATALDFAYSIHTEIGNKAIAAKINMKLMPLSHVLSSGDQVEIITAENESPKLEWLQFLQTRKAKSEVLGFFRSSSRKGLDEKDIPTPKKVKQMRTKAARGKQIIATCCNPIPGDSVVGFLSDDGTVTLHKKSCQVANAMAAKYGDRIVIPEWSGIGKEFLVRLSIRGFDRLGMINEITRYVSLVMGVNIRRIDLGSEGGIFDGYIDVYVNDKNVLDLLVSKLMNVEGIQNVQRTEIQ